MTRRVLSLVALCALLGGTPAGAQERLAAVAESARRALERGDLGRLLSSGDRIHLQLPSARPSGPVGLGQAEASLRTLIGRGGDQRVTIASYRETGSERGFVELRREFRPPGGGQVRDQQILLSYRRTDGRWMLVEVRVF